MDKKEFINAIKENLDIPKYESERKKRLRNMFLSEIATFFVLVGGFYIARLIFSNLIHYDNNVVVFETSCLFGALVILYFFLGGFLFYNPFESNKNFKDYIKIKCAGTFLNFFNLKSIKGCISWSDLKTSNLFSDFSYLKYDDVLEGEYNEVNYKIAEIEMNNGKCTYTTFKGIVITFPFNKEINSETLVTTKGDFNIRNAKTGADYVMLLICTILGILAIVMLFCDDLNIINPIYLFGFIVVVPIAWIFMENYRMKKEMNSIKLEDIDFDKKFCIYSKDQIEARYLITPAFMERMKNIQTAFGTNNIKCSFYEDKIMFAMSTNKDFFELSSLYKTMYDDIFIENFYEEITSIYKIIDYFKIGEHTGL